MHKHLLQHFVADLQPEDSGNYSCEIRGRRSSVLASVVHLVSIRGKSHLSPVLYVSPVHALPSARRMQKFVHWHFIFMNIYKYIIKTKGTPRKLLISRHFCSSDPWRMKLKSAALN